MGSKTVPEYPGQEHGPTLLPFVDIQLAELVCPIRVCTFPAVYILICRWKVMQIGILRIISIIKSAPP